MIRLVFTTLKNILNQFKPSQFKDPYLWVMQQLGHITLGLYLGYLIGWYALLFWVLWETYQLIKSKNWQDFLEDLVFETLGVLAFFTQQYTLALLILIIYQVIKFKLWQKK